ncbi:MAG TPA: TIGR01777 family oxidoreductase [Acidimicrobiales bacterium]
MEVLVTGSSGLIGSALVSELRARGHGIRRLVRRPAGVGEVMWDPKAGTIDAAGIEGVNAVVHLAGAGIGDHRWTESYKAEIRESRAVATELLARTLAGLDHKPEVLLSGSAVGIYGNRADEPLTEASPPGDGFLADVCIAWEAATAPASDAGIRVAHLRTGVVLSTKGGALRKQLPLFKAFLGGRFGKGTQWQSWISIVDEVGAIVHLLAADVHGPVNLTAPEPVTNKEFTRVLGTVLQRPAPLPIPRFGPSLVLGTELATNLLYEGQRVLPEALETSGYPFVHPKLEAALRALLAEAL